MRIPACPTWWNAVRGDRLPEYWAWQWHRNRSGLDRADRVIVPARSHGVLLDRVYGAVSRVSVVPNAARRATEGAMPEQSYVFAAGRWWDDGKNGRVLDQAAADLPLPVLMAGALTGPNGASVDLSHAISLGQLTPMQTGTHMAQAAIFAAPSLYEPFGLAVLEAASRGATLLLADIPTFRELWNDCAIFVKPRDAAAWSGAIMALMADDDRRAALGGLGADAGGGVIVPTSVDDPAPGLCRGHAQCGGAGLMRFVVYTHSLVSDWNHGNAHFLRGVLRELEARGHDTLALEPADSWSRTNLIADRGCGGGRPLCHGFSGADVPCL